MKGGGYYPPRYFFIWPCCRQFSQCVHLQDTFGAVGCPAAVALHGVSAEIARLGTDPHR